MKQDIKQFYKLIKNYLETNCEIYIDTEVKVIHNGEYLTRDSFLEVISNIFYMNIDKDNLINSWLNKNIEEMVGDLHEYINSCVVDLGRTSWVVKKNDLIINEKLIKSLFGGKYSYSFIDNYFSQWKQDAIISYNESLMGIKKRY